jgi:PAS domain S-box-containing protein
MWQRRKSLRFLIEVSRGQSLFWIMLAWLLFCLSTPAEAPGKVDKADTSQKRVLFIYTARKDEPYTAAFERVMQQRLSEGMAGRLDYYSEYIDDQRFFEQRYREALRDFLRRKYEDRRFDLVVTIGGAAINFAIDHGAELFPETPVVFYGGKGRPRPTFTGVVSKLDLRSTIEVALRLQPNTKRVFVVAGASEHDRGYESIARRQLQPLEGRIDFTYLSGLPLDVLLKEVAHLPPDSIIYYLVVTRDGTGARFYVYDVMEKVIEAANAPIYGFTDLHMISGVLGGNTVVADKLAGQTAEVALRVLHGEKPENISVAEPEPNVNMFDWRQLQRWGINEDKLPPGSIVRFKEPTFWERYRHRVIAALAVIGVQTLLITFLLLERSRRQRAMQDLRKSEEQFRLLFENSKDAILITDDQGNFLRVNQAACDLLGYSQDQFLRLNATDLLSADAPLAADRRRNYLEEGYEVGEWSLARLDGERRTTLYMSCRFAPGLHLNILRDITERKQAEDALCESEEKFRQLAEHIDAVFFICERYGGQAPGRLLYVSPAYERVWGRSPEPLYRDILIWPESLQPEDLKRVIAALEGIPQKGFDEEFRIVRPNGEFRWVHMRLFPIFDEDGMVHRIAGIADDITERKHAEQSLSQAFTRIEQLKEQLQAENVYLQEEIKLNHSFDEIIGESTELKYVFHKVEQVALADTTVLLLGETGTGKELVARAIHRSSRRKDRPFIKVNCTTLPASLIESELFGHEKGAFTGAHARKFGRFELANEGTLFLDEIGELPLELQTKLLRVLQEGEFERLGSSQMIKVDVRIIAATNRNMKIELQNGLFREDLWYRLSVFPITLPPLRQRKEDIPLLVNHFVNIFSKKLGKDLRSVAPGAMKALQSYTWPGNIRELANVIERAVINAQGSVLFLAEKLDPSRTLNVQSLNGKSLAEMERDIILQRLEETNWKIEGPGGAAQSLGLKPSTLRLRMSKFGIQRPNAHD